MIKIVAFVRRLDVVGITAINWYRAIGPLTYLDRNDPNFKVWIIGQEELKKLIARGMSDIILEHDLFVVSRLFAGREGRPEFIEAIHGHGGRVVFDTDDDLSDDFRDLGRGEDFKGIVGDVDAVTVSTPYLAKHLQGYIGYKPWVLPNHVDVRWFAKTSMQAKRVVDGLTIGFIGTASHYDDWKYPVEALRQIALEHNVTIVAAGYVPDYLKDLPNLVELKPVPYVKYPALMRQFDVVCCSLNREDGFCKSKSSIKALEAMSAARTLSNGKVGGAAVVATKMPVYSRCVSHRHNGLLVDNDGWYDALSLLVEDTRLRNKLAVAGHRYVKKHRDIANGWKRWRNAYRQILGGSDGN